MEFKIKGNRHQYTVSAGRTEIRLLPHREKEVYDPWSMVMGFFFNGPTNRYVLEVKKRELYPSRGGEDNEIERRRRAKRVERRDWILGSLGIVAMVAALIFFAWALFHADSSPHQVKNSEKIAKLESYDPYNHYELNELAAEYVEDEFGIEPVQAYVWIDILRYDTESTCSTIYYKTEDGLWYRWRRNWYVLLPAEFEEMVNYVAFTPDAGNSYEDRCYVEDADKIAELDASDPEYYGEIKSRLMDYVKKELGDKPTKIAFRVNIDNYEERQFELIIWYQLGGGKWCSYEENSFTLPEDLKSMLIREFIDPNG